MLFRSFDNTIDNPSGGDSYFTWYYTWSIPDNAYVGWFATVNGNKIFTPSSVLSRNTWHFVTLVRSGGYFAIYHNGVIAAAAFGPVSYNLLAGRTRIGYNNSTTMNGYIDEYRITKGVARSVTPPTEAFPNQ